MEGKDIFHIRDATVFRHFQIFDVKALNHQEKFIPRLQWPSPWGPLGCARMSLCSNSVSSPDDDFSFPGQQPTLPAQLLQGRALSFQHQLSVSQSSLYLGPNLAKCGGMTCTHSHGVIGPTET